jgi:hypothetical protein
LPSPQEKINLNARRSGPWNSSKKIDSIVVLNKSEKVVVLFALFRFFNFSSLLFLSWIKMGRMEENREQDKIELPGGSP